MKKLRPALLSTVLLAIAVLTGKAQSPAEVGGITYILNADGTATVTTKGNSSASSSNSYSGDIFIPSSILVNNNLYQVTGISNAAFRYSSSSQIHLPSTVKGTLADDLMSNNKLIENFVFPDNLTISSGKYSFQNCTAIKKVFLSYKETSIPLSTFNGTTSLEFLALPSGVLSLGNHSLEKTSLINGLYLNSNLKTLGQEFLYGSGLKELWLPQSIFIEGYIENNTQIFEGSQFTRLILDAQLEGLTNTQNLSLPFIGMELEEIVCNYNKNTSYYPLYLTSKSTETKLWCYNEDVSSGIRGVLNTETSTAKSFMFKNVIYTSNILGMLPPVYFGEGEIDLNDYKGLCQLNDITYTTDDNDIAVINGTQVKFLKAGLVKITASKAGETFANPTRTLCIMPNTVTIKLEQGETQGTAKPVYSCGWAEENGKGWSQEFITSHITKAPDLKTITIGTDGQTASVPYNAQSDCFVFIYDSSTEHYESLEEDKSVQPIDITLPEIDEKTYGDASFSLRELDNEVLKDYDISAEYTLSTSSPGSVLSLTPEGIVEILGAGEATISLRLLDNADLYNILNPERTFKVKKRKATFTVESASIEDDAVTIPEPKVTFEGVLDKDLQDVKSKLTLQWTATTVAEGEYNLAPVTIPLLDNYELTYTQPSDGVRLTITRAVNRKIVKVDAEDKAGTVTVTVTGGCKIKIGDNVIELSEGETTVDLSKFPVPVTIYCDYPERVTKMDLTSSNASNLEFDDNLQGITEIDVTGTGLTGDDITASDSIKELIKGLQDDKENNGDGEEEGDDDDNGNGDNNGDDGDGEDDGNGNGNGDSGDGDDDDNNGNNSGDGNDNDNGNDGNDGDNTGGNQGGNNQGNEGEGDGEEQEPSNPDDPSAEELIYHRVVIGEYNSAHGSVDYIVKPEHVNNKGHILHGVDVTFVITPNAGYSIESCTVNGEKVKIENGTYIHTNLSEDIVFRALFSQTSALGNTFSDPSMLSVFGRTVTVNGAESAITVRDLSGKTVATSSSESVTVNAPGVYIIESGNYRWKIKLK